MKILFKNLLPILILALVLISYKSDAQNSMTGDGFGGRLWYVSHNYQVGAYSAFTLCGDDNQLYGWGENFWGVLGNGTNISTIAPVPATGMNNVKFYSTGYVMAAIKYDNSAWVWGLGYSPAVPTGFTTTPVQKLTNVRFVDAGFTEVVFVKNDGTVWAIGRNDFGELGNGTTSASPVTTAVQMTGITNAVRAAAIGSANAATATIILLKDGTVKITGGGGWYQAVNSTIPVPLPGLNNIVDIKGNACGAFALDSGGHVYAFGKEFAMPAFPNFPTLGLGTPTGNIVPPTG